AEAQPGRTVPVKELKKFETAQKQFNRTIDLLIKLGNDSVKDKVDKEVAIETKVSEDKIESRFVASTIFSRTTGGITLAGLKQLKKDVNGRFDAMKKGGKLTSLDQKLLKQIDLVSTKKALDAQRGRVAR